MEKESLLFGANFLQRVHWKQPLYAMIWLYLRFAQFSLIQNQDESILLSSNWFLWLKQWVHRHSGASLYSCHSTLLYITAPSALIPIKLCTATKQLTKNKYIFTIYMPRMDSYTAVLAKYKFKYLHVCTQDSACISY